MRNDEKKDDCERHTSIIVTLLAAGNEENDDKYKPG
jgi:hypothetical protein